MQRIYIYEAEILSLTICIAYVGLLSRVLVAREDGAASAYMCIDVHPTVCNVDPDIDLTVYHRLWYVGACRNLSTLR